MMNTILRILKFIRLVDESNNLSITNILVVTIGIKLALTPEIDPVVITGFIVSLLNYGYKRHVMIKSQQQEELANRYKEVELKAISTINELTEKVNKQLEENENTLKYHTDMIDKLRVASGFKTLSEN